MVKEVQEHNKVGLEYTSEGIFFNGKSIYFWSGEFPYYRTDSEYWEDRLIKIKESGVNFITAYIPWNLHEKEEGKYDFSGKNGDERCNIIKLIKLIDKLGMYFIPKPGPFICAEVQHGGIPDWLTGNHPEVKTKDSNGKDVGFRQDNKPLPEFLNSTYIKYVKLWYTAVYENVLSEFQYPKGPVVAMQIENEFPYSTSELADPFSWGYSEEIIDMFRQWSKERYKNIERYNVLHCSNYSKFDVIVPPRKIDKEIECKEKWLHYQDWVMFREEYGVKTLKLYSDIFNKLGVSVPFYHNAGMLEDETPMNFGSLSDVMWMGVNFWLGKPPAKDIEAYTQGIRRLKQLKGAQPNRPNIAPELNWGWSRAIEADFLTRYTMPFLKGTNIYTIADGNSTGKLNGVPYTNNPEPYPGSSPIDALGNKTDSYKMLRRLTRFTENEGAEFNLTKYTADVAIGFYTPYNYAYVYSKYGNVDKSLYKNKIKIPVGTNEFMQEMIKGFIGKNIDYHCVDIGRASLEALLNIPAIVILTQEVMDLNTQEKLISYVRNGGKLIVMPQIPEIDLQFNHASVFKESIFNNIELQDGKADFSEFEKNKAIWSPIIFDDTKETLAVRRKFENGELVYLNKYITDADVYKKIFQCMDIESSYAYSNDNQVEVISVENPIKKCIYLYIINRGCEDKKLNIAYKDALESGLYKEISVESGMESVSILKVRKGKVESYSINGFNGTHKDSYM